jgi:hypothetical protein
MSKVYKFGEFVLISSNENKENNKSKKDIVCKCGWGWNKDETSKKDMYKCHKCGEDNTKKYKK